MSEIIVELKREIKKMLRNMLPTYVSMDRSPEAVKKRIIVDEIINVVSKQQNQENLVYASLSNENIIVVDEKQKGTTTGEICKTINGSEYDDDSGKEWIASYDTNAKAEVTNKIKIRISHPIPHLLNSLLTLIEYLSSRKDVDLLVINGYIGKKEYVKAISRQMERLKVSFCSYEDYHISEDKPDIFILNVVHDKYIYKTFGGVECIRENAKYIAIVPYDNTNKGNDIDFVKSYSVLSILKPDKLIVSKTIYPLIKDNYCQTITMSNPKFDPIYRKINQKIRVPDNWRKIEKKRAILWTTSHGHDKWDTFTQELCFDLYVKDIIRYFSVHKDMALIFRPHPVLIEEFVSQHHLWTTNELNRLKDFFNNSGNMIWDDTDDYGISFVLSDGLLTEDTTGINYSYLPTKKPICVSYRSKDCIAGFNDELIKHFYKAYNWKEIENYFEMIRCGEDPMYEKRMETVADYVSTFDGRNGERMGEVIIDDYKNWSE